MKNRFKQNVFSDAIKEKMFSEMAFKKKRIGLREFAKEANVSAATLSRVENYKKPDLETFFRLCFWMKKSPQEYYDYGFSVKQSKMVNSCSIGLLTHF